MCGAHGVLLLAWRVSWRGHEVDRRSEMPGEPVGFGGGHSNRNDASRGRVSVVQAVGAEPRRGTDNIPRERRSL
jgi:hypothetical protein